MFSVIYEKQRGENVFKEKTSLRLKRLKDFPLPAKTLPTRLEEIKLFKEEVCERFHKDNFSWLISFQKEVQLEAELVTSPIYNPIYKSGLKGGNFIFDKKRGDTLRPDFLLHNQFEGYNGLLIEMKTRNGREAVELVLNMRELEEKLKKDNHKWGDFVEEETAENELKKIRKDFHLQSDDQITKYQDYCELHGYKFVLLVVNSHVHDYGMYYNSCLSLIDKQLALIKRKLGKKDFSKILEKKHNYYSFFDETDDHLSELESSWSSLCESMNLPSEGTFDYYKEHKEEINKEMIIELANNLPRTKGWVNNSILKTSHQVDDTLTYHDTMTRTCSIEFGTNYQKQEDCTGFRTRTNPLLYLAIAEMESIQRLKVIDLTPFRLTQRKLFEMIKFTQDNKTLFKKYEELNATYGEYMSNANKLRSNRVEMAIGNARKQFSKVLKTLREKAELLNLEVSDSCYIRPVEGFIKEKKLREQIPCHIDYMGESSTKMREIISNIDDYLAGNTFLFEQEIVFENPLHGLLSSRLGEIYSRAGSTFINKLYADKTFRYLRVIMMIFDQYQADTKSVLARKKEVFEGYELITEWCKVSYMKNLPIVIVSSPPINNDYNGILVINTFHVERSEIDDYLLEADYFETEDGLMRMQNIIRMHPHIISQFNEYLCAYAGDFLFFNTYKINSDETLLHRCMYWTINRQMVKFASLIYLLYQKATLELTLGKEDIKKEFAGLIVSDIRIALFLKNLRLNYKNYVDKLQEKLQKSLINFHIEDPIFGIKIKDIQINLALINIKQIHPKKDGFISTQIQKKFILKDGEHMNHFERSNFYDLDFGFNYSTDENFDRIFREGIFQSKEELDPDGTAKLINYFDSSTFHPQIILYSVLNAFSDNYGEDDTRSSTHLPLNQSYWAKNTASSVYVPDEYNFNKIYEEVPKGDKGTKGEIYGFVSMKVPEASLELLQLVADAIDAQAHQVTIGDFLNKFNNQKFSINFVQTKEQKGPDKRIFYITIVNKRIAYICFDNAFEEFLKREDVDILEKPGEKKFQTFEMKMKKRFIRGLLTLFTLDATRFGDEMNCQGLKSMVFFFMKCGYFNQLEGNWCISILDSLSKRIIVLPKGFVKLMQKALFNDKDKYMSDFGNILRYARGNKHVRKFFDEAAKEYPGLEKDECMIKRVGFVLGVLNRCGTVMSTLIGHTFVTIQNSLFKRIDADWCTMSDDALGMFLIYSKFDFTKKLDNELIERFLNYCKSKEIWSVSPDGTCIIDEQGKVTLTYTEWSLISWGLLLLLYKSLCQNISTKKSGQGFTGEVLQVFMGYGKAILAYYKQLVNLGSTMQYFSAYEDLMSMMGSIYSLYILGAPMEMISNMFYLSSSLIKTIYRVDLIEPFGFKNPFWGPPELTLSFWMIPEAIRYTGFSGKERLLALYETNNFNNLENLINVNEEDVELIENYKKLSIIIIDNNEYIKSGKIDLETKETKAVSTNRVSLFILTLNKLKTKEVFFNILKRNKDKLIRSIISDLDSIINYDLNVKEILEQIYLLRQITSSEIPKDEFEAYKKYKAEENTKIKKFIEEGLTLKELAGSIVKSLTKEFKVFMIINYPKNYIRILLFLNKYLSRGFQLSYNKLSRASQIKSRLGFKTRKNLNFFTEKIPKDKFNYSPETLNNTSICNVLREFSSKTTIDEISSLSKNTYYMEVEFNRERMEFYTNLNIIGGTVSFQSNHNFEITKEWTKVDSVITSNMFYFDINDILTYVIEVLIRKVKEPVLYVMKPNYKNLTPFKEECNFIYRLLTTYGFNDSTIVANYNSISQTLNTNKAPRTMRLMEDRQIMSQTKLNHSFERKLEFDVHFSKDMEVSRYTPNNFDDDDLIRYAYKNNKKGFVILNGKTIKVSNLINKLSSNQFYFKNFNLWSKWKSFTFVKFSTKMFGNFQFFGIIWRDNILGLFKTKSEGSSSKYILVTSSSSLEVSIVVDMCLTITKYTADTYGDIFQELKKNLAVDKRNPSFVTINSDGTYTVSAEKGSYVQYHFINIEDCTVTHNAILRDNSLLLVPLGKIETIIEDPYADIDEEKGKAKYYLAYPTFIYNFRTDFQLLDKNKNPMRFSKESRFRLLPILNGNELPTKYVPFMTLAIYLNFMCNPNYDFRETTLEDWATCAWLYAFDLDFDFYINNRDNFNTHNMDEEIQFLLKELYKTSNINEDIASTFIKFMMGNKRITFELKDNNHLMLITKFLDKKDSDPLKIALSPYFTFESNLDFPRFLRNDIFFKVTKNKFEKTKVEKVNREIDLKELFREENFESNWVKKHEFFESDQELKQSLFIKSELQHCLIKTCLSYGLIKKGCINSKVAEFIEDTTRLKIEVELNYLDF